MRELCPRIMYVMNYSFKSCRENLTTKTRRENSTSNLNISAKTEYTRLYIIIIWVLGANLVLLPFFKPKLRRI